MNLPMTKPKKPPSLKSLRKKLDKLFNNYIRLRDGQCILSGLKDHLHCSHYYDYMQCPNLRFDERNANAMNRSIHFKHHHGRAPDYARWMYNNHSKAFMEKLYRDSLIQCEYDRTKYEKLIKIYTRKLAKLV
jgi:hypothetical protein